MNLKKVTAILAVVAMVGTMLVGCGAKETATDAATEAPATEEAAVEEAAPAASGDKLVVYGIYKAGDQSWFINEGAAAQKAVEDLGGEFVYVDAKMSPEEYLKAIDNAIANKASGIVTCIPDQTMSQAVVDKCAEANMPIVAADDALQDADANKIAPWVGIDGYVIGEANGEWVANYITDNSLVADDTALLVMTMDTVSSCVPRVDGEIAKFKEMLPDFAEGNIFRADYDGTTDKGNTAAAAVITANPQIKTWIVTGANEEGTIGALRALESVGLEKDACVVGLGAYMAKDEWNNKGADGTAMKAAAYFSSESVGAGSVDVLMKIINGEEAPEATAVDAVVVTPDNYKDVMGSYAD